MKRRNKSAFDRCVESVAARGGAADPRAVCATAGVRKYGQAEMTRRAIAGKKRAARRRGNPDLVRTYFRTKAEAQKFADNLRGRGQTAHAGVDGSGYFVEHWGSKRNAGRPDYETQMRALSQQIDEAMQKREFKRVRDLQTKIQRLYSKSVGGLRKGAARYRGSRGNPPYSIVAKDGHELGLVQSRQEAFAEARSLAESRDEPVEVVWKGKTGYKSKWFNPSRFRRRPRRGHFEDRSNPAEAARAVSEEFHGRKVREMIPVTERRHYHKFLAELGELTLLVIYTPDGRRKVELSKFDGALLCTNEDKNQLFIKGGDQSVELRDFGIRDPHEKEHLGELRKIAYFTDKEHLGDEGGEADYHHSFSKPYPHVDFRTRDTHLEISGGKYKITREGIVG